MAMIALPPGSGLPEWISESYDYIARVVVDVTIGSLAAGVVARFIRRRNRAYRLHLFAVCLAGAALVAWTLTALIASTALRDGQFCFAPEYWVEVPATCVSHHPTLLLALPLTVAFVLAVAGLLFAFPPQRRWTVLGLFALALAASVLEIKADLALVKPGFFVNGGITSIRHALFELVGDPLNCGPGLAIGVALVVVRMMQRIDRTQHPDAAKIPTARSQP